MGPAAWKVFLLFAIPIGGGIPAGVLLARDSGLPWPTSALLYFLSDVALACVFEPVVLILIALTKRSARATRFKDALRAAVLKTTARYAKNPRPLALVMISFGVDPMTGRMATILAGHGFVAGWLMAILGDMLYFGILMISTLWLDGILGDGTLTTIIILVAMFVIPEIVSRVKERRSAAKEIV